MVFPAITNLGRPITREDPVVATVSAHMPEPTSTPRDSSINARVEAMPRRRYGIETGALYLLPSGLLVTPLEQTSKTSCNVRVIVGNDTYPAGGYDLSVSMGELEVAREVVLKLAEPA